MPKPTYPTMKFTIGLKILPFTPDCCQVVYVENYYDQAINQAIIQNVDQIGAHFRRHGLDFVYIPFLGADDRVEERVRYHAPYLTSDITYEQLPQSSLLLNYMVRPENRNYIQPSLLVYGYQHDGEQVFHGWTVDQTNSTDLLASLLKIADEISGFDDRVGLSVDPDRPVDNVKYSLSDVSFSFTGSKKFKVGSVEACHDSGTRFDFEEPEESAVLPYEEDEPLETLMDNLQSTVRRLQLHGISLAALHELIDKQAPLSRMRITADYRIFLPDYNNMEIKMTTLPKALFFLFLRYPEGIVLKTLPDYYTELYNIYKQLRPKSNDERIRVTITELVNPYGNKINENIARIRAPFVEKFDEHLAQNYFVTGRKGERYLIRLNRDMIDWDE